MNTFKNKVAVVTGAAEGIGKAIAKKCLLEGMKVVLADINAISLENCKKELSAIADAEIISVITDVSSEPSIQKLAETTLNQFGKVNLLFNNAGILGPIGPIWEVKATSLEEVININLMSTIYGLQTFIPIMLKQNEDCYIVNTASGAGLHTSPNISGYTITKHSIVALTEVLYYDLKQRNINNINVSVLCPGSVRTNFVEKVNIKEADSSEMSDRVSLFKNRVREGISPDEVAEKTFDSIQDNQFYILTQSEHKTLIKNRLEDILNESNPSRAL